MTVRGFLITVLAILVAACQQDGAEPPRNFSGFFAFGIPTAGVCEGLPRVDVATANEVQCIGLIDRQLKFPRGVAVIGNDILVVDKGSNLGERNDRRGAVFHYSARADGIGYLKRQLISELDQPSGIAVWGGREKYIFVSTRNQVLRFVLGEGVAQAEVVIDQIPTHGWHYLTGIHISGNALYLTVPSATDHCESDVHDVAFPCREGDPDTPVEQQTALIRRYRIGPSGDVSAEFDVIARGLRDALAVVSDSERELLYAADNGWDQINLDDSTYEYDVTPPDELNVVSLQNTETPHFGWPYCFGRSFLSPPYEGKGIECDEFVAPVLSLPAHSAPLGIALVGRSVWLNLHGFNPKGRRTVRISLDADGMPEGAVEEMIHWIFGRELGIGFGRPFGIANNADGALVVTDDWNHALFKVVLKNDVR